MGEIGIIVNSADMYAMAQQASKSCTKCVEVVLSHTYEESLNWAQKLSESGFRILISRGGHSARIREHGLSIPVIDIPFTGNNIASLLIQAKKKYGAFGVVGNSQLIQTAKELEEAIGHDIHYYEVKCWKDFERQILSAKDAGLRAIVGGYDASSFAAAAGLQSFCIAGSRFEIQTALLEAQKVLAILDQEKRWNETFRTVLDSIREGIVILDAGGVVTHVNRQAKKLLQANGQMMLGIPVQAGALQEKIQEALKNGTQVYDELFEANDYKYTSSISPIKVGDAIAGAVVVLQEVEYVRKIEQKIRQKLAQRGLVASKTFNDILGGSAAIRETIQKAKQYSIVNSTVLITGESGTGKELFAQSIHNFSLRREEAFVAINCATIPSNLLESELFGYADGAFTGAKKGGKIGLFELAHNGTIFLDEIGEISVEMQARMLRVLEERQIMRIGDDRMIPVDIRIIAATNKDLRRMVAEGTFREDFFYRLNILSLALPPLRDRVEDLTILIRFFIGKFSNRHNRNAIRITPAGMQALLGYEWPGNARELRNVMERLVVTNQGEVADRAQIIAALGIPAVQAVKLTPFLPACLPAQAEIGGEKLKERSEKELIRRVLEQTGGNKAEAARRLGVSRPTLHRKLKEIL